MAKFDVFEREGALFRRPFGVRAAIVDDVLNGEKWERYQGDRSKPVHFGEHVGVREFDDELAEPKAARRRA